MNRYYLLILTLIMANQASADQLDGLEHLDTLLVLGVISVVSILVLFVSLFVTIVNRLSKEFKVSYGINFSCASLIICALLALATLGSQIDPGFRLTCVGVIVLSILLIILNYKVGAKQNSED